MTAASVFVALTQGAVMVSIPTMKLWNARCFRLVLDRNFCKPKVAGSNPAAGTSLSAFRMALLHQVFCLTALLEVPQH